MKILATVCSAAGHKKFFIIKYSSQKIITTLFPDLDKKMFHERAPSDGHAFLVLILNA
jgi:hypothetical protein